MMVTRLKKLTLFIAFGALALIFVTGAALADSPTPTDPGADSNQPNHLQQMQQWLGPEAWGQMIQRMTEIHGAEFSGQMLQQMSQGGDCHNGGMSGMMGGWGGHGQGFWGGMMNSLQGMANGFGGMGGGMMGR